MLKSSILTGEFLNFPLKYLSLMNISTADRSSSPSNGKGSFLGFQNSWLLLFPPKSATVWMSRLDHLSRDNDFTMLVAPSVLLPNIFLWTDAQRPHKNTPRFTEQYVGNGVPHSPHLFEFSEALTKNFKSCSADSALCLLIIYSLESSGIDVSILPPLISSKRWSLLPSNVITGYLNQLHVYLIVSLLWKMCYFLLAFELYFKFIRNTLVIFAIWQP